MLRSGKSEGVVVSWLGEGWDGSVSQERPARVHATNAVLCLANPKGVVTRGMTNRGILRSRLFFALIVLASVSLLSGCHFAIGCDPCPYCDRPEVVSDRMLFVNWSNFVTVAKLDGTGGGGLNVGGLLDDPIGIALDLGAGKMYVSNYGNSTLVKANLDGTDAEVLSLPVNSGCNGVGLDDTAGKLYIANNSSDSITVVTLEDMSWTVHAVATLERPTDVAVDPVAGKMYITNDNDTVTVANLDGSGGSSMDLNSVLDSPLGIALDLPNRKMYIVQNGGVATANLDGTGGALLPGTTGGRGLALDLAAREIYVTRADNLITITNLDGTGAENIVAHPVSIPSGIALAP